jgi:hypothetical protein
MVVFGNALYVGGTSLHRYANKVWDAGNVPQPPGRIMDLAATTAYLYALVNTDSSGLSQELYRWPGSGQWGKVTFSDTDYPRLQAIYGETDSKGIPISVYLFVGASRGGNFSNPDTADYAVYNYDDTNYLGRVASGTGLLTGAAFDGTNHYFSTNGGGIYKGTPGNLPHLPNSQSDIKGLIRITDSPSYQILALCYNGNILNVTSSNATKLNSNNIGLNLRGPAAIYTQGSTQLLLVATERKDTTSPTCGYREIFITSGPIATSTPGEISFREPGAVPSSSMDDTTRYKDTIESKPLNGIFQVPAIVDLAMPLFASVQGTGTAKDNTDGGLWSYRVRDGIWQWNAEE